MNQPTEASSSTTKHLSKSPLWGSPYFTDEGFTRRIRPHNMMQTISTTATAPASWMIDPTLVALWLGDIAMAVSVTVAAAPALTAVDKAIVEQSAAGTRSVLLHSMKQTALDILSNPIAYYRSPTFAWMALTYISTYTTANMLKTWNSQNLEYKKTAANRDCTPTRDTTHSTTSSSSKKDTVVVVATTATNSAASLVKDRAYARMFGQVPRPVPALSYAAWLSRDAFGIGAGFVLPAYVAPHVQAATGWSAGTSSTVAQMGTPVLAQTVAGPLHLLGLTIYNAGPQDTWAARYNSFAGSVKSVTMARMLRILPGYGIAGVLNEKGRAWWKHQVHYRITVPPEDKSSGIRPRGDKTISMDVATYQ